MGCMRQDGNVCCSYNQTCSSTSSSKDEPASVYRQRHPDVTESDRTRSVTTSEGQRRGRRRWESDHGPNARWHTSAGSRTGRTPWDRPAVWNVGSTQTDRARPANWCYAAAQLHKGGAVDHIFSRASVDRPSIGDTDAVLFSQGLFQSLVFHAGTWHVAAARSRSRSARTWKDVSNCSATATHGMRRKHNDEQDVWKWNSMTRSTNRQLAWTVLRSQFRHVCWQRDSSPED